MAKCLFCEKGVSFGRNIRHRASGGWALRAPKTNRTFKANIQKTTLVVSGVKVQVKLCTSCMRSMSKAR